MVASDIPCLRARSAVFAPASCSFNTAIICSSVNLARFICPSFFRPDSNSIWRKYSVAGQSQIGAGRFLEIGDRQARKWIAGDAKIPESAAMLLILMIALGVAPDQVTRMQQ